MKLLIVDDTRDTREFFQVALASENIEVQTVSSGNAAIERTRDEGFDVILLDVEMPGLNGWETVAELRRLPDGEKLSIIIFTAFGDLQARQKAVEAGADGLLFKPLLPEQILAEIHKHSHKHLL